MASPFQQRSNVYGWSEKRPLGAKRPIGTAVTQSGAKRVYWTWEKATFPAGSRWYPMTMVQDVKGDWYLGQAKRK